MVAIVVPEVDAIKRWALENDIPGTLSVLCNDDQIKEFIMNDMIRLGKLAGLKSFEQVIKSSRISNQSVYNPVIINEVLMYFCLI